MLVSACPSINIAEGDILAWSSLSSDDWSVASTRVKFLPTNDRVMCPEQNFKIFPFPIPSPSLAAAFKFCEKMKSRLFSPDTDAQTRYFLTLTASSLAMDNDCSNGKRNLMWGPVAKYLIKDNKTIPTQEVPLDGLRQQNTETGVHGVNMYSNREWLRTKVKVYEKLSNKYNHSKCSEERFEQDIERGYCQYYDDSQGPDRTQDLAENGIVTMDDKISALYRDNMRISTLRSLFIFFIQRDNLK